ncbi:Amidohydro-rel domain-containing protein [Favolaschia claudopus]|uniref:Amidohydro-rel domain-containing protein n=1 Tax=Favolaschia claudopus TaxID=2862362 RepID=A0AAW0DJN7_9AGAR
MSSGKPSSTIIDDRDVSVKYSGTWTPGGTKNEHGGTVSSSLKVGDHFTVPFSGTSIAVYGTFDSSSAGVQTSYAIDNRSPDTITSGSSPNDSFQQLFWQSDKLDDGDHNLVVTMVSVNNVGDGEGTIWFDYFNVTLGNNLAGSNSNSGSSTAPNSQTSSQSSSTSSSSPSATNSAGPGATGGSSSHTSVIAGVVVAVVIVILAASLALRRWKRGRRFASFDAMANGPPPTQPFLDQPPIPMSGVPGAAPLAGPYTGRPSPSPLPYKSGSSGFDSSQTYAASNQLPYQQPPQQGGYSPGPGPQGFAAQASYNPYAGLPSRHQPQSSYAGSSTSLPSTSQNPGSSVFSASTNADPDSVANLKRRQQQVVNQYEQGVSGSAPVVQHTDSGRRDLEPTAGPAPAELPPVYTPN